jgi:hypothetical protein
MVFDLYQELNEQKHDSSDSWKMIFIHYEELIEHEQDS